MQRASAPPVRARWDDPGNNLRPLWPRHYPGRVFTKAYYRYGRYGARFLRRFPVFKPVVRVALRPLVAYARIRIRP